MLWLVRVCSGESRFGKAVMASYGGVIGGKSRFGSAVMVRSVKIRIGLLWFGLAVKASHGLSLCGK